MLTRWVLIAILVWSQYQFWVVHEGWSKLQAVRVRAEKADAKHAELVEELAELEQELAYLEQEHDWIDTHAREDLGMVAEGETLYIQPNGPKI